MWGQWAATRSAIISIASSSVVPAADVLPALEPAELAEALAAGLEDSSTEAEQAARGTRRTVPSAPSAVRRENPPGAAPSPVPGFMCPAIL
ncbi:hypothetical protein [Actinomyces howellii]|uniref:Uncharacterized protein n=1 Tax=Actinomyces howellii TaxID=52771 RepID=A0A448HFC1_9ACTO|nr:hypothetical protein [Actinomyces howellii]VEG27002.1 Uncharacterised protein [Actinomyces howellii]